MAKDSDILRENADNCLHLADNAADEPASKRYRRIAEAWTALAEARDWLDGHPPQTQTERATDLAEGTIDWLSKDAGSDDAENRKRRLIEGPTEFRDARVDNE